MIVEIITQNFVGKITKYPFATICLILGSVLLLILLSVLLILILLLIMLLSVLILILTTR